MLTLIYMSPGMFSDSCCKMPSFSPMACEEIKQFLLWRFIHGTSIEPRNLLYAVTACHLDLKAISLVNPSNHAVKFVLHVHASI